ncbi:MAG: RusA family crossover junction endodeoxyribonuclease [Synergistaceae bacterium]|nr:RusA family crossover junction endodeoxyribonuclease [Synergistaceae bacterium]MBR1603241.1 RusA family crossover junction endodeoxyribonuclease [Synergistaceae bacterium]
MTKIFKFEVPGAAVPQGRPRLTTIGGYARAYDPPKCKAYKEFVRECAIAQCRPDLNNLYLGAVEIKVTEYRAIPKSWSKVRQLKALNGVIKPIIKPDTDNILKIIKDALNGVMWKDDAQVVHDDITKVYDAEPRVTVEVEYL